VLAGSVSGGRRASGGGGAHAGPQDGLTDAQAEEGITGEGQHNRLKLSIII